MNCQKASELASRQYDQPLSLSKKISLKFHLLICKHCRNFNKNIEQLSHSMQSFLRGDDNKDQKTDTSDSDDSDSQLK
ncbi:hypothetical protein [Marinagarivorans algicola]|uniref:anti-sigma factor family protein n=1 Tax=Marinagarivorans algicola TaxID=1513270 RepID=UPI0006B5ACC7|nr:hypothetical protein [Marinagarivorans algicola]